MITIPFVLDVTNYSRITIRSQNGDVVPGQPGQLISNVYVLLSNSGLVV